MCSALLGWEAEPSSCAADRLGQPDDEGAHQHAKGDAGVQPLGQSTQGPGTATTTAWRKKDAADQRVGAC